MKQIHQDVFIFKLLINTTPYFIITLLPVKKCSGLNQERNLHQIKQRLQDKTALNKYVGGFYVRDNRRWTFSLEEALLWIMDSHFSGKQQFEVKTS